MTTLSRRSIAKGVAWGVPAVSLGAAAPARAASPIPGTDRGVFVSATYNGGTIGYQPNESTGNVGPSTLSGSFVGGTTYFESDLNWADATNKPTNSSLYVNGEGTFTPSGNSTTAGSYGSTSGFWFSSPTTAMGTGTGYSGTSTLASGAKFTTTFTYTIPSGTAFVYPRVNGSTWQSSTLTASLTALTTTGNNFLSNYQANATVTLAVPTVVTNADGSKTFTGTITTTTTSAISTTATKPYQQVTFLPPITLTPAGYTSLTISSSVSSATVTTSTGQTYNLSGMLQSTTIRP